MKTDTSDQQAGLASMGRKRMIRRLALAFAWRYLFALLFLKGAGWLFFKLILGSVWSPLSALVVLIMMNAVGPVWFAVWLFEEVLAEGCGGIRVQLVQTGQQE